MVTVPGRHNFACEWAWRMRHLAEARRLALGKDLELLRKMRPRLKEASGFVAPAVRGAAQDFAAAWRDFAAAAGTRAGAIGNEAVVGHRARDLLRRPEALAAAARDGPAESAELGREAAQVAARLRSWSAEARRAAGVRASDGVEGHRRARRALLAGERRLTGEMMLARRARALEEKRMLEKGQVDGKISERGWRAKGRALDDEWAWLHKQRAALTKTARERLDAEGVAPAGDNDGPAGPNDELATAAGRRRVMAATEDEQTRRLIELLGRHHLRLAQIAGARARRERLEASHRRAGRMRSAAEDAALLKSAAAAGRRIDDIDREILANPTARKLAEERGLAGRLLQEGEARRRRGRKRGRERD